MWEWAAGQEGHLKGGRGREAGGAYKKLRAVPAARGCPQGSLVLAIPHPRRLSHRAQHEAPFISQETIFGTYKGGGNGNPFQYSRLGNPVDRGVHGVAKSWARLSN